MAAPNGSEDVEDYGWLERRISWSIGQTIRELLFAGDISSSPAGRSTRLTPLMRHAPQIGSSATCPPRRVFTAQSEVDVCRAYRQRALDTHWMAH